MPKRVVGRFYFKTTRNDNLVGEFSNNQSGDDVSTESCDLQKPQPKDKPEAKRYRSTWQEGGKAMFSDLTITPKLGNKTLFKLEWRGNANFDGEGMMCDEILIGDYHQVL